MAKRGRKPKEEKKGYFLEREEQAVIDYNNADTNEEKDKIYNEILKPAFIKMIESIIRRYHLYAPEEEFSETFNDTLSFMLTKIGNFRPYINGYWPISETPEVEKEAVYFNEEKYNDKKQNASDEDPKYIYILTSVHDGVVKSYFIREERHFKAYSYCGTVAKNYLIQKITQYQKKITRSTPYEEVNDAIDNNIRYTEEENPFSSIAGELIKRMSVEIQGILNRGDELCLSGNEIKVGSALIELLNNWEQILDDGGSNKFNKSSILYFLREETRLDTQDIRKGMKRYKGIYGTTKQLLLS